MKRCTKCGRAVDDESQIVSYSSCPWCGGVLESDLAGPQTLADAVQLLWTIDHAAPYNERMAVSNLKDHCPSLTSVIRDIHVAGDVGALALLRDGKVEGARRVLRDDAHWSEPAIDNLFDAYSSISSQSEQWRREKRTEQHPVVDTEPTLTIKTRVEDYWIEDSVMESPPPPPPAPAPTPTPAPQSPSPNGGDNHAHMKTAILVLALVVVAAVVMVVIKSNNVWIPVDKTGSSSSTDSESSSSTDSSSSSSTDTSSSSSTDSESSSSSISDSGSSSSSGSTSTSGSSNGPSVDVRESLAAYSWADLSKISQLMRDAGSWNDALAVAQRYNLVDQGGRFPNATKEVAMLDGTTLRMRLVDIMHDELSSGGGVAGMTFLGSTVSHHGRMSGKTTTDGGWQSSEMRGWMNTTLLRQLPKDVSSAIVRVRKLSNNAGWSRSESCVSATDDYLWLPSIVELAGPVDWEYHTDPPNAPLYNAVFNAEGSQYAYYSQCGVVDDDANGCLSLGEEWWLRSTAASTGRGRYVSAGGDPSLFGDSNQSLGVVVGYCV